MYKQCIYIYIYIYIQCTHIYALYILDYHIISGKNKHIINQSYANKLTIYEPRQVEYNNILNIQTQ